ncbi:hypothetical protein HAX54_018974 [Datura stramonium]|uniref:Uncharacterized protein n=1 Tax=Datura stramonium TaxID=4076 RepID=A0ABS8UQH2_DATST|nr:hypothetical protein [Datura stramonium]
MERTYGRTVRVVVRTNDPSYVPVGSTSTMTSKGNKKQQEATTRKEITKGRKLRDESESDSSSGSESEERGEEAESDGDNPPADNAEEGNDDAEESGVEDIEAEGSGDKESAIEKSGEQVDSEPATTLDVRHGKDQKRVIREGVIQWTDSMDYVIEGWDVLSTRTFRIRDHVQEARK